MPSSIEQVLCLFFVHRGLHWRRLVAATSVSIYSLGMETVDENREPKN